MPLGAEEEGMVLMKQWMDAGKTGAEAYDLLKEKRPDIVQRHAHDQRWGGGASVVRKTVPPPKPGRYAPTWDALVAQVEQEHPELQGKDKYYQVGEIAKSMPGGRDAWDAHVATQRRQGKG